MSKTLLTSIICGAIVLILYCLFMLFLFYKYNPDKKPKQSWFDKKISKSYKKHYKRTVKDIKKKISRAIKSNNNFIVYDSLKLNNEITNDFKVLGVQIEDEDDGFIINTKFKW